MPDIDFYEHVFASPDVAERPSFSLSFAVDRIKVADLIRMHVELAYDKKDAPPESGQLNAWLRSHCDLSAPRSLDGAIEDAQVGLAQNKYFLLLNGRQLRDLEETVALDEVNAVVFLRLTPLQGG